MGVRVVEEIVRGRATRRMTMEVLVEQREEEEAIGEDHQHLAAVGP